MTICERWKRRFALGIRAVKVAPFEGGDENRDQLAQARAGFERLEAIRVKFPQVSLRVDCHERFTPENARTLAPKFKALGLEWLEEPSPPGTVLAELRRGGLSWRWANCSLAKNAFANCSKRSGRM
jgi:L-alanine-DL-glutamate epimerase-like enolase superfamily enzyme